MYYRVQHVTRFIYSASITESIMEIRMQPRTEGMQRCHSFKLTINPPSRITEYRDYAHNVIHSFDIPGLHRQLAVTAEALVERNPLAMIPDALPVSAWDALDALIDTGDFWDFLVPSPFTEPTELLHQLATELNATQRHEDPLTLVKQINQGIYDAFDYVPEVTTVDSVIDHAIEPRKGVCQDFAHVMIAILRGLRIPARYVSGYLFHRENDYARSVDDATHAWIEAYLPEIGWLGFDPTNNVIADERHIRVAVGRDYAEAPPTRGVFKGEAETELRVSVKVEQLDQLPFEEVRFIAPEPDLLDLDDVANADTTLEQMQQQQQ